MKGLKTLRESIKGNDVDSFHGHLGELERVVQNNERMKQLLEEAGSCVKWRSTNTSWHITVHQT